MQRFALSIFLGPVLLLSAAVTQGAELKIGFIDSERIFAGYQGTEEARTEFQTDIDKWTRELEERKKDLERLTEEFQSQSLILSQAKRLERDDEISRERSNLDAFVQEIWGPAGKVAQRNDQLTRPIVEKIREVLNEIAEADGYSIIFDATDGNVVYADQALDLTDRVIVALNEQQ